MTGRRAVDTTEKATSVRRPGPAGTSAHDGVHEERLRGLGPGEPVAVDPHPGDVGGRAQRERLRQRVLRALRVPQGDVEGRAGAGPHPDRVEPTAGAEIPDVR